MHEFNWFHWIFEKLPVDFEVTHDNLHFVSVAFVMLLLLTAAFFTYRRYRKPETRLVPDEKWSIPLMMEVISEMFLGLMEGVMGPRASRYFPLIGTLFVYIFTCNLMGVIPGLVPPTDNINTNAACAVVVFLYYNYQGIRQQGFRTYLKHFMGPVLWLAPLMLVVELIGHLVRPVSLSVRLFGNITGDHLVLGIFSNLVPLIVPVIFMGMAIFVSFIQAFVFSLLSMIYIALATEVTEHH